MSAALEPLAAAAGVDERTLRRAIAEGAIRARRPSPYRLELERGEEEYIRTHWPVLSSLRAALRTEPTVECAVLFGSAARGDDAVESDIDIAVWLRDARSANHRALARRLSRHTRRAVHVIDVRDAETHPGLLLAVLEQGRVLVDRAGRWPELHGRAVDLRRGAAERRRTLAAAANEARDFFAQAAAPR